MSPTYYFLHSSIYYYIEDNLYRRYQIYQKRSLYMKGNFVTRYLTKKLLDALSNAVDVSLDQLVYTVDMSSMIWAMPSICDVFTTIGRQCRGLEDNDDRRIDGIQPSLLNETDGKIYIKIYHGVPVILTAKTDQHSNPVVQLKTLNEKHCRETLDIFISKLRKRQIKINASKWKYNNSLNRPGTGNFQPYMTDIKRRTFNDVFINQKEKYLLINTIDEFVNKRKWYADNNLPYHLGVLLYGPPGTGKSVIAQAIADHVNARLLVLNGDDIGFISETADTSSYKPTENSYTVFLVEDVDCGFAMKDIIRPMKWNMYDDDETDDTDDEKKRPAGLATILNCIDGFGAPENVIYVLTTNHIENLDPALIRPGRCDLKIEVGYVCEETFKQFIKFHYGVDINYPIIINRQITFAELQIHVMRGETVDQLIEFMKGDDHDENNTDPIYSV